MQFIASNILKSEIGEQWECMSERGDKRRKLWTIILHVPHIHVRVDCKMFLILLQHFFVFSSPLINALFNYSWSSYCVYNKFTFFRSPRSSASSSSSSSFCPDVKFYSYARRSIHKIRLVFKFQIHVIRFSNFWCRDVLNIKWFFNNKNDDIERRYYHYFACNAITLLWLRGERFKCSSIIHFQAILCHENASATEITVNFWIIHFKLNCDTIKQF